MAIVNETLESESLSITLTAGQTRQLPTNGDFLYIDSLTAPIQIGVNSTQKLSTVRAGYTLQGSPQKREIKYVFFKNNTAGTITITPVWGTGNFNNPANVTIANPTFNLSAADRDDIRGLPEVCTPALQTITTNTTITAGKRAITVANTGAANITVAGGTLAPGQVVSWSAPGRFDTLAAVAINAVGSSALVSTLV
jgi:hypothetical protein